MSETGRAARLNHMESPSLFISRDPDHDLLSAIEFGRVCDGQPPDAGTRCDDGFAWFVPPRLRRPRGFMILGFNEFDPFDLDASEIWGGPRFSAPTLGLFDVPAGEIVIAAKAHLGDEPTINRAYFRWRWRATARRRSASGAAASSRAT